MEKSQTKVKTPIQDKRRLQPRPLTKSFLATATLSWVLAAVLASFKPNHYVQAVPYLLLTHFTPKCVKVEVPQDMILTINYDSPDTLPIPEDDGVEIARRNGKRTERKKYMIDATIAVSQGKYVANNRNFEIRKNSGTFTYNTNGSDPVTMCVRSMTASSDMPKRIALKVDATIPIDEEEKKRRKAEERKEKMANDSQVNRNLNALESHLRNLERHVAILLKNAEYAKEQETKYNRISETMYSASLWWPMIQLVILGVTGVMQGRYILEYIKRHGL